MALTKNIKKIAALGLAVGFVGLPLGAYAQAQEDTIITATINSSITMTTSGNVGVTVTPVVGGAQSSASDTVSVSTNNSNGYTLTLENNDANTSLVNGPDTIAAHTGTQASPTALANNSWGYAVASVGGFDGSYTAISNQTSHSSVWAGVPAASSPNTISTTLSPGIGDTNTVWYSVKVDTTKPDGQYVDTVSYTATANP